jgi:3-isopropylmalate dehydrogenase
MSTNTAFHVAVLPGDGIGPEVMTPTLEILRRIETTTPSLAFRFTEGAAGAGHYQKTGKSMPDSTIKLCEDADAILLAAGRTAFHFRSLCRRATGATHSRRA